LPVIFGSANPFGLLLLSCADRGRHLFSIYSFLLIHVLIASSTALDKSPFFPPNLSIVLNLSCFSSSPGRSTVIRPIFNRLLWLEFCCTVPRVKCSSSKQTAGCQISLLCLLSFFVQPQFAYQLINIIYYVISHL